MAALTVTASGVKTGQNARVMRGTAAVTVTTGQVVYKDASNGKFYLAQCDGTAAEAALAGVALHGAAADQELSVCYYDDDFTPGATLTAGTSYFVGTGAGGIIPAGDLVSTNWVSQVMVAKSTSKAILDLLVTGAQV